MTTNNIEVEKTIVILPDGETREAQFHIWDFDPEDTQLVKLSLTFANREIVRNEDDFWSALCSIRRELEAEGILIKCNGSSKDVWPSGMSIDMSAGEKAYRLELGQQPTVKNIVSIFESGTDIFPVTLDEQEAFFNQWAKSVTSS